LRPEKKTDVIYLEILVYLVVTVTTTFFGHVEIYIDAQISNESSEWEQ
jgi:hypothetical protein